MKNVQLQRSLQKKLEGILKNEDLFKGVARLDLQDGNKITAAPEARESTHICAYTLVMCDIRHSKERGRLEYARVVNSKRRL